MRDYFVLFIVLVGVPIGLFVIVYTNDVLLKLEKRITVLEHAIDGAVEKKMECGE